MSRCRQSAAGARAPLAASASAARRRQRRRRALAGQQSRRRRRADARSPRAAQSRAHRCERRSRRASLSLSPLAASGAPRVAQARRRRAAIAGRREPTMAGGSTAHPLAPCRRCATEGNVRQTQTTETERAVVRRQAVGQPLTATDTLTTPRRRPLGRRRRATPAWPTARGGSTRQHAFEPMRHSGARRSAASKVSRQT
jgi:hypothetical protein